MSEGLEYEFNADTYERYLVIRLVEHGDQGSREIASVHIPLSDLKAQLELAE